MLAATVEGSTIIRKTAVRSILRQAIKDIIGTIQINIVIDILHFHMLQFNVTVNQNVFGHKNHANHCYLWNTCMMVSHRDRNISQYDIKRTQNDLVGKKTVASFVCLKLKQ